MSNIAKTIQDIKSLKIQGAQNVALKSLESLSTLSDKNYSTKSVFLKDVHRQAKRLSKSRPTEPALRQALSYVYFSLLEEEGNLEKLKKRLLILCKDYQKYLKESKDDIAENAKLIIRGNVYTICHSSSVINAIVKNKKNVKHVFASETRPLGQGYMTAKDLGKENIKTTLVVDSAMANFMKEADVLVIGADAVTADGSVVNKIGSLTAAMIAKQYKIPVYCLTGTYKFDPMTLEKEEPIEERSPKEIYSKRLPKSVNIRNPAFDIIPSKYIKGIITEEGIVNPRSAGRIIKKLLKRRL